MTEQDPHGGTVQEDALDEEMDLTPDGRYIPYSGGSMGWLDNSGVLKSERNNNYRLFEAMESEHVRSTLFQRWGQVTDQRQAARVASSNSVSMLMSGSGKPTPFQITTESGVVTGETTDVSLYGMRLQFTDPVEIHKGDLVRVDLLDDQREPLLSVQARVMWIKQEGVTRPVWFLGIAFHQLTADTESYLREFVQR